MIYFSRALGNMVLLKDQEQTMDVATFNQFHNFTCNLIEIDTAEKGFHTLLPPLKEKCFSDSEYSNLQAMYDLLYPNSLITQAYQPFFHGIKANDNRQGRVYFFVIKIS